MSSNPRDDALREASRTPAYRKVKRVAPEQSPVTPAGKEPDPDLGHELIRKERYTSAEFMQLEWERMWTKTWLVGCREEEIPDVGDYITTEIGTESLLMAVKAGRERGRKERGITTPNVVLPTSAHAAFEKAPGHEAVSREALVRSVVDSVHPAGGFRFPVEIGGFRDARLHARGEFVGPQSRGERLVAGMRVRERTVHRGEQVHVGRAG